MGLPCSKVQPVTGFLKRRTGETKQAGTDFLALAMADVSQEDLRKEFARVAKNLDRWLKDACEDARDDFFGATLEEVQVLINSRLEC